MRRKLLCLSAAMMVGIWAAKISCLSAAGIALAAFLCAARMHCVDEGVMCKNRQTKTIYFWIVVFLVVGSARFMIQDHIYQSSQWINSEKAREIKAEVLSIDRSDRVIIRIKTADEKTANAKCLVTLGHYGGDETDDQPDLSDLIGCAISFHGVITEPDSARNPRCFDYHEYLRSRGISHTSKIYSFKVIQRNAAFPVVLKRRLFRFRERLVAMIPGKSDSESKTFLVGVIFGDTNEMTDEMKEDFRRNGTAHILAVSGLHIGLIYSVFSALRKKTGLPWITPLFLMVLLAYGTVTLWSVSVTRACVMVILMEFGKFSDRRYDLLTSLGMVSMLTLMHNPYALFGTSFQMSYLAVVSIGMINPVVRSKLPDSVPRSIITSLSVQIGLVPYTAYTFNMVPLGALLINIPVIVLMSVLMTVAVSAVSLYVTSQAVMAVLGIFNAIGTESMSESIFGNIVMPFINIQFHALIKLAQLILFMNGKFSDLTILSPDVVSPPLILLAAIYIVIFFICSEELMIARIRDKHSWLTSETMRYSLAAALALMLLSIPLSYSGFDDADIVMVDVGQGDSVNFRYGSTDVVIDGGGSDSYNIGKNTLKPYFLKNGVSRVDLAYATHLHTDHYKGLAELASEGMIDKLITKGRTGDVIRIQNSGFFGIFSKGTFEKENYIEIIYPDIQDSHTDDENKNSLIFKVHIKGVTVLVTGDLGEEGERALVEKYRGSDVLDCDILKVCHHGSKYSSSAEFLEAVSPKVALIGVGKNNLYGHPSSETLKRLEAYGAEVYRTDRDGAIAVKIRRDREGRVELVATTMLGS